MLRCQIIIKAAAVGDYRPKEERRRKLKTAGDLVLELTRNPDILAELGNRKKENRQILVGFAAETKGAAFCRGESAKAFDFIVRMMFCVQGQGLPVIRIL